MTDSCLAGGGTMGALMRAFDWSSTVLGPVCDWPQSLKTAVSICLNSQFPIVLWWGTELTVLYNDGYIPMLGIKHPGRALGRPGHEVWSEIWDIVGPLLSRVMTKGEANWADDLLLFINRSGYPEETYFRFSYSPIRDETGGVGGVFAPVSETTGKVIAERRLRTLRDLSEGATRPKDSSEALRAAAAVLERNPWDVPFGALYLFNSDRTGADLLATAGIEAGASPIPRYADAQWALWDSACTAELTRIDGARTFFPALPREPWGEEPETLVVAPIAGAGQAASFGFLVAGVNSRRRLDGEYLSFFSLAAGQIGTAIANVRAFEEERRRAEALAEIDRAKTQFFSNVSHEFRTPLTLLLGPLEDAMARPGAVDEETRAGLRIAHRNALRLMRLVNALLDFSRMEAGRARAQFEPVEIGTFTAELASVFRAAIESAGLKFRVECEPLASPVLIDRDMWEKIVFNLLSNAWKFTFEGEIGIRLRAVGGRIEVTVSDTGAGIAKSEVDRIFDRFHRVEGARARTHEGSGIGLALVKDLVSLHGGEIRVESETGKGSRFIVSIPVRRAPNGVLTAPPMDRTIANAWVDEILRWQPAPLPEPAEARGARPRVLLADDNADMREYAARLLRNKFDVTAAIDGEQALAAVRADPPDLVLSDIMMPQLDGFGLLAALRADPATREIPVILLSARAGEESRIEGMEAGADDYLVKPFSALELMARVESHLKLAVARKKAACELRQSEEFNRSIVESSDDSICVLDLSGRILSANPRAIASDLDGPGDLRGVQWAEAFAGSRRELAAKAIETAIAGRVGRVEFETSRGGAHRWWNVVVSSVRDDSGAAVRLLAVARDVTEQKQVEHQLMLLVRASSTLLAETPESVVDSIIRLAQEFIAADAYAVWRKDAEQQWRIVSCSGLSEKFGGVLASKILPPGETIAVEDVLTRSYLAERVEEYRKEGICSLMAAPLRSGGEVTGTLVFYYRSGRHFTPAEVTLCTALGNMAAAGLEAARLYKEQKLLSEQTENARKRAVFVARAGTILASSLDTERTLRAITELVVPEVADWCAIDLLEAEGPPHRITVRHMDPNLVEKAIRLRAKYPPKEDFGFAEALRSGKPVLAAEITDDDLRGTAQSQEHLEGLRELGIRSTILAPLIVRGERLGVVTFARSERLFTAEDPPFIEEIAQRAAFAVHSARLHQAVAESAERLNVAAAAAGLGIFEWDVKTSAVRWENQRVFDIFRRTREQGPITYREFFDSWCDPDDRTKLLTEMEAAMTERRPLSAQARVRLEGGEWIRVEFSGQLDFDQNGEARRFVGVVSDVTERRKIEERLRERAKLESVGLLAGGVAHDFNNLLTGILGNSSLALDFIHARHPARPMIENALAAGERAAALTQQMLAYSGRGRFVIAPVDLSSLVREMSGLLRTSIDRSIDLRLDLAPALPRVEADSVQMQQLVMNLIINAAESMEGRGGAVAMRTFECDLDEEAVTRLNPAFDVTAGRYVCLEVKDEGCGMDEATLSRIFDPFFTTKFTGRGLGLSAVLGIVRGHKGSLEVASEPGRGTMFRIHLPPMLSLRQQTAAPRGVLRTVLVVDDEEIVLNTAADMIEARGFRVIRARNGLEALRAFEDRQGRIDLTILDLSMPVMQGEEALRLIHGKWPDARVVISTGLAPEEAERQIQSLRVTGVLRKPYTSGRLSELLRESGLEAGAAL